jgi:hypothetical protein
VYCFRILSNKLVLKPETLFYYTITSTPAHFVASSATKKTQDLHLDAPFFAFQSLEVGDASRVGVVDVVLVGVVLEVALKLFLGVAVAEKSPT